MNNINYAYKSGALEGTLTTMTFLFEIPGVIITDRAAFKKFIESEIESARQKAAEYYKKNSN
jgi:hypothetical protein